MVWQCADVSGQVHTHHLLEALLVQGNNDPGGLERRCWWRPWLCSLHSLAAISVLSLSCPATQFLPPWLTSLFISSLACTLLLPSCLGCCSLSSCFPDMVPAAPANILEGAASLNEQEEGQLDIMLEAIRLGSGLSNTSQGTNLQSLSTGSLLVHGCI